MNNNMNELNLNEMEQVNGGIIRSLVILSVYLGGKAFQLGKKINKELTEDN